MVEQKKPVAKRPVAKQDTTVRVVTLQDNVIYFGNRLHAKGIELEVPKAFAAAWVGRGIAKYLKPSPTVDKSIRPKATK